MFENNRGNDGIAVSPLPRGSFEKPPAKIVQKTIPRHSVDLEARLFVKSNFEKSLDGGNLLAFFEKHNSHPEGEAFVAGGKPVLVALTPATIGALNTGEIVEASLEEVREFQREKVERARSFVATKRELARQKFILLTGDDKGFDSAWNEKMRAAATLETIEEML
jgi:hypothetical protein